MGFLKNKKILITGILNKRSIAYGIAQSMYSQNASLAFTCINQKHKKKIQSIAKKFNSKIVIKCNFFYNHDVKNLFLRLSKYWKSFDGFVHALAYIPKKQFFEYDLNNINKKDYLNTHNFTSYSLIHMLQLCQKQLNKNSSIITLTYLGSKKSIPYYNVLGSAKSSLEANVRYIANILGKHQIRINAISSGPIKTTSSYSIPNFKKILNYSKNYSPIRRLITNYEIGNVAAFLCSNLSSGITGQIIYVDGGLSISGMNHLQ
ncbi:enoyl-ACP reductase [Buchnera aphidicola]|uniref:enoyl-ACP reductase FabI n=1 Tax=Buchnera aphidicola TaxID=9 RepID=UPI0034643DD4